MYFRTAAAAFLLASLASAQTFVVDAAGGPGSHYTDIAPAVAAVPDGAVLVVRPGEYSSFTINAKSLTVLGEPGAIFGSNLGDSFTISGLAPGQRAVVRGLTYTSHFNDPGYVSCQNCAGQILLDDVEQAFGSGAFRLDVDQCAQVEVTNCVFNGTNASYGARVVASDVQFVDTILQGGRVGALVAVGEPALEHVGGSVQLAGCNLVGGLGIFAPGGSAIEMQGGELRILRDSFLTPGGGNPSGIQIDGVGNVRADPAVSATQVAAGIGLTVLEMPALTTTGGELGGMASAALEGPTGDFGIIVLGTPGAAVFVPGWSDPVWVANPVIMGSGALAPRLEVNLPVPNNASLAGMTFAWQGVSIDPGVGIQASNAVWVVLRN